MKRSWDKEPPSFPSTILTLLTIYHAECVKVMFAADMNLTLQIA